jgi:hypothetical protein
MDIPILTEQDELGIYHALRLHDRVRHIHLDLPPSILHKVLVLMDEHFPILEHLSLSFTAQNSILSHSLRPFWPQIYAISLFLASVPQEDYGFSPPLSPLSHSSSPISKLLVIFGQGY